MLIIFHFFYVFSKVMLIFGSFGGMRCKEYAILVVADVEDTSQKLIVTIINNKMTFAKNLLLEESIIQW